MPHYRTCPLRLPALMSMGIGLIAGFMVGQLLVSGAIAQTTATPPPSPKAASAPESSQAAIALARHLKAIGATMYGAYWCPHCAEQRRLFGRTAFNLYIHYIECASDGYRAQPQLCKQAKIEGYPTWVIRGKTYMGTQSLEELAELSGYQGSRNF